MAASPKPAVSFLGLGAMGFGMATNLLHQGHTVTGFDVWAPTLEKFAQAGGRTAPTPAAAVHAAAHCIVMVATAAQAQSVLFDGPHPAVPALPTGATLLLCSTVPCAYVQGLAAALVAAGRSDVLLVDSPVSGGTVRAAAGTLSIMAAADTDRDTDRDTATDTDSAAGLLLLLDSPAGPLLRAMADPAKLYVVRGGVGAASNLKMCHQVLAAVQILAAAEALGLAVHLGVAPETAAEAVLGGDAWSWMFENRLPRLLLLAAAGAAGGPAAVVVQVASAVSIILKDAGIITSEARRAGFPAPLTAVAEQVYLTAWGRGWGADDDASVLRVYSEGVGTVTVAADNDDDDDDKVALVVDLLKGIHLCAAAEAIAFAAHVGLDLDQVFALCSNAAGGSRMLDAVGPPMVRAFQASRAAAAQGWTTGPAADEAPGAAGHLRLQAVSDGLQRAVDAAQRLRMPLFLGNQALTMMRLAAGTGGSELAAAAVVKAWVV